MTQREKSPEIQGMVKTIAFGGRGILRHNNLVVFVPFTAPGDEVLVKIDHQKKRFAEGTLLRVISPGPSRTSPHCPYFGSCGGCQLQHLTSTAQTEAKRLFIEDAFIRIGKLSPPPISIVPAQECWHYRRHIRLKLKPQGSGFSAGFAGTDPSIHVKISHCPLFLPLEHPLFQTLTPLLSTLSSQGIESATLRLIKTPSAKFLLAFDFPSVLPINNALVEDLLSSTPLWQGVVMQSPKECKTWGNPLCEVQTLGLTLSFSPFGFIQNHPQQSENLYRAILESIPTDSATLLDLYSGIGVTSLLASKAGKKVIGIENHKETVQLAQMNASLNFVKDVVFYEEKAEILGPELLRKERPEVVLCNPPRTGLSPLLVSALIKEKPPCILYVSCMPSTAARDLQALSMAGYVIDAVQAFDLFPQTTHVETLIKLKFTVRPHQN